MLTRSFGRLLAASAGLLAFVALTNRWVSWHDAVYKYGSPDDIKYQAMANAAPGLLRYRIPEPYAERFAVDWVVGSTAKLLDISVISSFRVWEALLALAICAVLAGTLFRLGTSLTVGIVCMAAFMLNAYTLRPYFFAPGSIDDILFVLGATIATCGLVLRSPAPLIGGLLLATAARQTALPPAAVAAAVVAIDQAWRARLKQWRMPVAASALLLPLACYAVIRVVAHPFSSPSPSVHTVTLLGAHLTPGILAEHLARCLNVLLSVGALLVGVWWLRRRALSRGNGDRPPMTDRAAIYACLAFGAAIVIQPVLLSPSWLQYNENRLSVLGLVPLVVALALTLRELEQQRVAVVSPRVAAGLVGLLALSSFHHVFSVIGGANKGQTVALEAVVAIVLLFVVQRYARPGAPTPSSSVRAPRSA